MNDSCPKIDVNLQALDDFVMEYLRMDSLVQPSAANELRSACQACRCHMASGRVEAAVDLAKKIWPPIFEDQRLLFRVKMQQFTEHLRVRDTFAAIRFLRKELAPLALDAYPEAYGEFRRSMLFFVYPPPTDPGAERPEKQDQEKLQNLKGADNMCSGEEGGEGKEKPSPVAAEASLEQREQTAKALEQTLRQATGVQEPRLTLLLTYLFQCCIACAKNVGATSIPELDTISSICFQGRDPPALTQEVGFSRCFPESDIQALVHAVDIPRHHAELSLRQAEGDIAQALKNELSRLRVHVDAVDSIVFEYALYRGLIRLAKASAGGDGNTESGSQRDQLPMDICDPGGCNGGDAVLGDPGEDVPLWVGRGDEGQSGKAMGGDVAESCRQYAVTNRLKHLAGKGLMDEVVRGVQALDPQFFDANPQLLFELKRCEFLKQVEAGNMPGALSLAREDLRPLAERCPGLLSSLKQTLATLLEAHPNTQAPTTVIANALQNALRESLGLEEPRLVQVLRCMLNIHADWFRMQRCKDRFEGVLGLSSLKDSPQLPSAAHANDKAGDAEVGSSGGERAMQSMEQPQSDGSRESGLTVPSEEAILTLMEFMALSRPIAIEFLMQHNGNIEAAIAHIIG